MVPIFQPGKRKSMTVEEIGVPTNVEGELGDYVVVSIPVTESHATAKQVRDQLAAVLRRPVLVVTHNMQFLVTKRLSPKDASVVIKQMEDALYELPNKDTSVGESEPVTPQEASVGGSDGVAGDGDRPRPSVNGDSSSAASSGVQAQVGGLESVDNPEVTQEGPPKSESIDG